MSHTTIVVPTFNESGNIAELVDRLSTAFSARDAEVLFVDDSNDDTPGVIQNVARDSPLPVRMIHRPFGERDGGLSGAVLRGIQESGSRYVVVMDGDLQHPPELAEQLVTATEEGPADVVVASRYLADGDVAGLGSGVRKAVSSASTLLARVAFPRRVGRACTDPMTGFFCLRRSALDLNRLRPRGFKILLEILARHELAVAEVPLLFGPRRSGNSKASLRNGLAFLLQIMSLRLGTTARLALVGAAGLLLNLLLMAGLIARGSSYLLAATAATEVTIAVNFCLQERLVYRDPRRRRYSLRTRALQFLAYNNMDALLRAPLLVFLVHSVDMAAVQAQAVTIMGSFLLRRAVNQKFIYRQRGRASAPAAPPRDDQKYLYVGRRQHRWIFWAQAVAFGGVAVSTVGLARNSRWTLVFFLPLIVMLAEQVLALRTSTFRRRITLPDHLFLVETYAPAQHPSVDIFLPTAGEPTDLLLNTYEHVRGIDWPGRVETFVLDDSGRPEVAELARRFGFTYLARPGSEFKKAGNLQYAYLRSQGDHIVILDADFVPRRDILRELVPYLAADPQVGIVQSPQYFSTGPELSWLERCAGATQEMFYRFIQPSRDAVGAAICVGTSALYRRAALDAIGGFPLIGHSEDVFTGVEMGRRGYQVQYVPVIVSQGRSPDDMLAFISQQYRWCEGSLALLTDPDFHRDTSLTGLQRVSFWSGFLYYLTTAVSAVVAPLGLLSMIWIFPSRVSSSNAIPLVGATLFWLAVYPVVASSRWRFEVLRVQVIYGFAHLFCLFDLLRGRPAEWVATNVRGSRRRGPSTRVTLAICLYLGATQLAIFGGLARGALEFGPGRYWASILLAALGAYIYLPTWWLSVVTLVGTGERPAATAPATPPHLPEPRGNRDSADTAPIAFVAGFSSVPQFDNDQRSRPGARRE